MRTHLPFLLFHLAVVMLSASMAAAELSPLPDLNPALIVLPGAEEVTHDLYKGRVRLIYALDTPYPADAVLGQIRSRLAELGWRQLNSNYFMPGVPTSHVTGWQAYSGVEEGTPVKGYSWSADWINGAGDVLLYGLKYAVPAHREMELSRVQIYGVFFPREVAQRILNSPDGILRE